MSVPILPPATGMHPTNMLEQPVEMRLTPTLMLCSPTWRRYYPETVPLLVRLLSRDARRMLLNCFALFLVWQAERRRAETTPYAPIYKGIDY